MIRAGSGSRKILLDCDPGLDDALAIFFGLGMSRAVDCDSIVATYGNAALYKTKRNLLKILSFLNKKLPIGSGSRVPLRGKALKARDVHGKDGLGGLSLPFKAGPKDQVFKNGIDLIIESVLSKKINTIIALGPLTDIARALTKSPSILKHLDEIVIMGGAVFVEGNVTSYAEFNFFCDPEAARIVLRANVKKRLVSLDVTRKTLLSKAHLRPLRGVDTNCARFIYDIASYLIASKKRQGLDGAPMHDPLTVGLAIDRTLGSYKRGCLDVKTKGKDRGKVIVKTGKPNTQFCHKVDRERFFKLFIKALSRIGREEIL